MDKPKLPKREEFSNLNDYLEAVGRFNSVFQEPIIQAIPNFKIDDKDEKSWLQFNKEFGGKVIVVKPFTQQDVDDLRYLTELAFDGACVSKFKEQLLKRVNQIADKIQRMV